MNNKNLVILTCRNRFFGQTRKPWSSLDVMKMVVLLQADGFDVEIYDFHEVLENDILIKNKIIFYAFSQIENNRDYINDIVYNLGRHNYLIPSYDLLKCHENKGYQELFKKEIGLSGLPASYYSSYKEVNPENIHFPVVVKSTKGTNGQGVFLVRNRDDFAQP
jgi:glutathione synthase/RimK-type ligase-like ATP-grasp enzyme